MRQHERLSRAILVGTTIAAAAWAALLTFSGGLVFHAPWGRVSSRDPIRPLGVALAAGMLYAFWPRTDHARTTRWPARLALGIAILTLAAGVRFGTFTAGGSDPSGYVSEAALWRTGLPILAAPPWVIAAPWREADRTAAPLGYVPGPRPGTQVPSYPPGLPLLMAAAQMIAGPGAEYFVVPFCGALLVWATYLLGTRLSTPWGGLMAAALMASSPPFLVWLVMPMSDVPAATFWTVAVIGALAGTVPGALGAGAATAVAVLTRPNLAPIALIVGLLIALRRRDRGPAVALYCLVSATGPLAVALINRSLYGSPFRSGYGDLGALYSMDFVWPNLQLYGSWFLATQTTIPLLGLLAPIARKDIRPIAAATVIGVSALVLCLYLPYRPFVDWPYLRFLLPAYPALFAGLAAVAITWGPKWGGTRWPQLLACVIALLVLHGLNYSNVATDLAVSEPRYRRVAEVAGRLPENVIFVAFQHSGSLRYYTGRDILRWDLMDRDGLDAALDHLERRGYRLVWVGDAEEAASLARSFAGSRFLARVNAATPTAVDGVRLIDLNSPR